MSKRMLLRLTFLLAILALLIVAPSVRATTDAARIPDSAFEDIDAYVQGEMARTASPGLAYAIVRDDQIVHMNTFGIADPSGRRVTPQTPFVVGSVGKNYTALAIRQLINAGRVNPNAPAQSYIPWFRLADAQASARITVQNLLDHKSGIPHWAGNQLYQLNERYTVEDLVRRAATVPLNSTPGTAFEYSNVNYLVLGLIVESLSGQSYAEYVQQHIFAPLQMRHSYTDYRDALADGLATGYQSRYGFYLPIREPYPPGMAPSGFSISSAEDMAHYLIAYLNDGMYRGASVLPLVVQPSAEPPGAWYDIHWNRQPPDPTAMQGQSGGTLSFNGDIQIIPDGKWGVVVLMNSRWTLDDFAPTVNAASIALQVARRMKRWGLPPDPPMSYQQCYLVIDVVLLMLVTIGVWEIVRLWKWSRTIFGIDARITRAAVLAVVIDLALAVALLALPISQGLALDYFLFSVPDIAIVVCGVSIILILVALVRIGILLLRANSERRAQQDAVTFGSEPGPLSR